MSGKSHVSRVPYRAIIAGGAGNPGLFSALSKTGWSKVAMDGTLPVARDMSWLYTHAGRNWIIVYVLRKNETT